MKTKSKLKILNDPIYGFVSISDDIIFRILETPYFQRLRRIQQLGFTNFVYPGANHSRFSHSLGCTYLMKKAIDILRIKGNQISKDEETAVVIAIMLHDIGHGPFSHTLESNIIENLSHEQVSKEIMTRINKSFGGELDLAIEIFLGKYKRKFLNKLISSQLDIDRIDYLVRDSFYTGVIEGSVNPDRIISTFNVANDDIVVDEKGIYSLEKFIVARRFMYWQVYLHKTVLAAEYMVINIFRKVKELIKNGDDIFFSQVLKGFIFTKDIDVLLDKFCLLDDFDIIFGIKQWAKSENKTLSYMCSCIINRNLPYFKIQNKPFDEDILSRYKEAAKDKYPIYKEDIDLLVFTGELKTISYQFDESEIKIMKKDAKVLNLSDFSDNFDFIKLLDNETKYFLCAPKDIIIKN